MVSLLCRKKNTNLYQKEYDNHAVYELRGVFFAACHLRTAVCGCQAPKFCTPYLKPYKLI